MIINGEKVPAFSATTLSIPETPADNFDAIVANSRDQYARSRMEVEAEIRDTIEQSEKYKKELADSGRQEPKLIIETGEKPVFKPVFNSEQKPNLKHTPTPQSDFMRQKISPNAAEGKERLGLKDLAALVGDQQTENVQGKTEAKKKGKNEPRKNQPNKEKNKTPKAKKQRSKKQISNKNSKKTTPVVPPVKPEVEYQEKSTIEVQPSHTPLPLSTPVKDSEDYASKDNSVDGILAIKHDKQ